MLHCFISDLFTLINANDLESLINSQVDTTQQVPDSVRTGTNTVETLLHAVHTQSVNPSDVLSGQHFNGVPALGMICRMLNKNAHVYNVVMCNILTPAWFLW